MNLRIFETPSEPAQAAEGATYKGALAAAGPDVGIFRRSRIFRRSNSMSTIAHQVGHWLGLNHSGFQSSLMWPKTNSTLRDMLPQEVINLVKGFQ